MNQQDSCKDTALCRKLYRRHCFTYRVRNGLSAGQHVEEDTANRSSFGC